MESNVNIEEQQYTTTKDNIKFGTYHNPSFEKDILTPIDLTSLNRDIGTLLSTINDFNTQYISLIASNANNINTIANEYKRKTTTYYLLAKFFERLVLSIKDSFNGSSPLANIDQSTIDDVISKLINEAKLEFIYKNQYGLDNRDLVNLLSTFFKHEHQIHSTNKKGGIILCDVSIKYSVYFFQRIMEKLNKFKEIKDFNSSNKDINMDNMIVLFDFLLILERIEALDLVLFNSFYYVDENDISNLDENGEEWQLIKKNFIRVVPNQSEVIYKAISDINKGMGVMGSILDNGFTSTSTLKNIFSSGWIVMGYKMNPKKAIFDGKKNDLIGDRPQSMIQMCNMMKIGIIKKLTMMSYPKIAFRKKLYLKREEKEITVDYIKQLVALLKSGKVEVDDSTTSNKVIDPTDIYLETIAKERKKDYVSTRLIHSSKITFANEKPSFFSFSKPKPNTTRDTLFIHIHGGGFIGTTTVVHEQYLRTWVNELNVPLIGIDYALSPQNKYPKAIDDIWQAYNWIINHAESEFNISTKRIILSGDSAGGNLIFSLVFLLIMHKKRLPDLILAEYPCCDTSLYNMSPSMLLCLDDDGFLNINFLKFCNEAYRNNYEDDEDPFLNPIKATEGLIKKMPLTYFFIGSCDPLRDGALRLMYKMSKQNVPYKTYEFKEYIHGFYGINNQTLRRTPTYILMKEIKEFLSKGENDTIV